MRTLHFFSDVYGPRLTGSPNHKAAAEWAIKQMTDWGMTNGHLEPWEFGHPGWSNEHLEVHLTSPVHDALVVEALAWTPGTNGTVNAPAFNLVPPQGPAATAPPGGLAATQHGPTQAELDAYLASVKDRVTRRGGPGRQGGIRPRQSHPPAGRLTDEQARCRFDPTFADNAGVPGSRTRPLRRSATGGSRPAA